MEEPNREVEYTPGEANNINLAQETKDEALELFKSFMTKVQACLTTQDDTEQRRPEAYVLFKQVVEEMQRQPSAKMVVNLGKSKDDIGSSGDVIDPLLEEILASFTSSLPRCQTNEGADYGIVNCYKRKFYYIELPKASTNSKIIAK